MLCGTAGIDVVDHRLRCGASSSVVRAATPSGPACCCVSRQKRIAWAGMNGHTDPHRAATLRGSRSDGEERRCAAAGTQAGSQTERRQPKPAQSDSSEHSRGFNPIQLPGRRRFRTGSAVVAMAASGAPALGCRWRRSRNVHTAFSIGVCIAAVRGVKRSGPIWAVGLDSVEVVLLTVQRSNEASRGIDGTS